MEDKGTKERKIRGGWRRKEERKTGDKKEQLTGRRNKEKDTRNGKKRRK